MRHPGIEPGSKPFSESPKLSLYFREQNVHVVGRFHSTDKLIARIKLVPFEIDKFLYTSIF